MRFPSSGRVSEQPFARIFGWLAHDRFTGALRVVDEPRAWVVWWRNGVIVDADSPAPQDTFGRVALELGHITSKALSDSVMRLAQTPGASQMQVLLELGAIRSETADHTARVALLQRATRAFSVPNAMYILD